MSESGAAAAPIVDLRGWVDGARPDPVKHQQRQVTAVILNAVVLAEELRCSLVLKGGALMAIAYGSARQTADVDFTARAEPESFEASFRDTMDRALDRARARLGYPDLRCRVQRIERQPRRDHFADARAPALVITIGYARVGTNQAKRLAEGKAATSIGLDISFKEPLIDTEEVAVLAGGPALAVYSVTEVIAEKLRAFLQQEERNRGRRQDIYDIAYLVDRHGAAELDHNAVLAALRVKCAARGITLSPAAIDDADLIQRARKEWPTLSLEVGELPEFDSCFATVRELYRSLPW